MADTYPDAEVIGTDLRCVFPYETPVFVRQLIEKMHVQPNTATMGTCQLQI
jgi:hypothetical protein